jgi:RNA polymerase sigma factor (sigma-70 family)
MNTNLAEVDEYTLAIRARDGDPDALSQLVTRLRGPLFAVAFAELRHFEDAQDAVADAILRICRNIGGLRDASQARAWMLRIVRNEARRRRPAPRSVPIGEETKVSSSNNAFLSLLRLDVERALRSLPADTASAVALFYLDGLGIREIAAHLDRPEGTIKYWLHRGREHLHQNLEGYAPMTPLITMPSSTSPSDTDALWHAAIVSSEIPAERLEEMRAEVRAAGWQNVRHIADVPLLRRGQNGHLPEALTGCRLIVLDEFVGGRSAFELSVLWRSTDEGRRAGILLLIDGRDDPAKTENTVLAAYLAGFDMLLTKPFERGELESFARRMRQVQQAGAP